MNLMSYQFGKVPHPHYEDHPIVKAAGAGQDDLGPRTVKGVVWHRMIGTLRGTDTYFKMPTTDALTDYGVGNAFTDGDVDDGVIIRWNDPLGRQSGWASGPLDHPYGDGLAFYAKYGINAINRDETSIEISGRSYTDPISDKVKHSVAAITAYWADQYHIPWDKFPISTQDGFSFVRWHQEFTIGTGKVCPGQVVMDATPEIIAMVSAILKHYQVATPAYPAVGAFPHPDGKDHVIAGTTWWAINRLIKAKVILPKLCRAGAGAEKAGPDYKPGDWFEVIYCLTADDRRSYWITKEGYRVPMIGTTPKTQFVL
jgi:hypothetical protein